MLQAAAWVRLLCVDFHPFLSIKCRHIGLSRRHTSPHTTAWRRHIKRTPFEWLSTLRRVGGR